MGAPLVFNIQKYAIHDGEGIRTTVFFKGCPSPAGGATTRRASAGSGS